jgi:hypothetical protein
MRQRWITVMAFVVAAAILAGGVVYHVAQRSDSGARPPAGIANDLPALPPAPLSVSLTSFVGDGRALIGSSSLIAVNAVGATITEIRLYDGETLVGREVFAAPVAPTASATFSWPAVRTGHHLLHATATGASAAEVAHSAPTRIEVVNGLFPVDEVRVAANGLSLVEAAATLGIDPSTAVVTSEPTPEAPTGSTISVTDAGAPLPAGSVLAAPAAAIAPSPSLPAPAPAGAEVPVIAATIDGCAATIATAGGELIVYETAGSGPGFTELGTVSSSSPLVTNELTPGQHVFVAGSAGAPASSAPVAVTAGPECLADLWNGGATLFDGLLTIEQPVPEVWMYVGVDGQPFTRVPAVGTVPALTGSADLGQLIPALSGEQVRLEVWQPAASPSEPATLVARSEATIPESQALTDFLGESAEVLLFGVGANGNVNSDGLDLAVTDASVQLQWQASSSRIDSVLWQVLTQPLGGDDRNASPPMMIATGVAGETDLPGVSISDLPKGGFPIPAQALTAGRNLDEGQPAFGLLAAPSFTSVASIPVGAAISATPIDLTALISDAAAAPVPAPGSQVWVRALPLSGGQIIGPPSNLMPVSLFDPDAEVPVVFAVDQVTFDPGYGANYQLDGCIRVTDVPWELDANGYPIVSTPGFGVSAFYRQPGTFCPGDWDPPPCTGSCAFVEAIVDGLSTVVGGLAAAWDVVAAAYNGIVTLAIEIAAQLNPYCLQARVAGAVVDWAADTNIGEQATDLCTSIARVATRAVVSAVMVSFGLPPTLPTSDQLLAIAEGDLTTLAVEYLKTLGVPCDEMKLSPAEAGLVASGIETAGGDVPIDTSAGVDVCGQMIGAVIGEVKKTVATALQAQVAASTGLPMPSTYEPGFEAILEPRAHYSGAVVRLDATPSAEPPAGFRCSFQASATAGERVTGSFEYRESLYLRNGSSAVALRVALPSFDIGYNGTIYLREGSDLYEGNIVTPTITTDKRCLPAVPGVAAQPVRAPLGRWTPGEAN